MPLKPQADRAAGQPPLQEKPREESEETGRSEPEWIEMVLSPCGTRRATSLFSQGPSKGRLLQPVVGDPESEAMLTLSKPCDLLTAEVSVHGRGPAALPPAEVFVHHRFG